MRPFRTRSNSGFVLLSTLFMMSLMLALISAYGLITNIELSINKRSGYSTTGFYAAEAGLNLRAEGIRQVFVGYNRPQGTSPDVNDSPCVDGNNGDGDYECAIYEFGNHDVVTYLDENPGNPLLLTIPPGELYQNLSAQEYRYNVKSIASGPDSRVEAFLELQFNSRLVPLFQFAAFYDKDLEILPGPTMVLSGPVHTNGDLYLNANNSLSVDGQVSTAHDLYRGRKNDSSCMSKPVQIKDPLTYIELINPCSSRSLATAADIAPYNGMVQTDTIEVTVPEPDALDPTEEQVYYALADLRLTLHLKADNTPNTAYSTTGVEVRELDGSIDTNRTTDLDACPGLINSKAVGNSYTFFNNREGAKLRMLEIDMQAFLDCVHNENLLEAGRALDDDTEGGLVFHLSVDGPDSDSTQTLYGVRLRNAEELQASVAAPIVQGLTVASDQGVYIVDHYNSIDKIPAAIMADTFNILSSNWDLANEETKSQQSLSSRVAANTTVNTAVLAGTDSTGGIEGSGGQDADQYNGGLENYPRFHEKWSGKTLTYRGSFVSLNTPQHNSGAWVYGNPQYEAPNRNWDYDLDFNDAANLPPLTPRFVYLKQELFVRKYELD